MVWKGSPAECGMSCRFWTGGVLNNSAAMPLILLKGEWPLRFRTANCARPALEERTDMKYLTAPLLIALAGCASAQTGEVANPLTNSTTGEACRSEQLNQFVGQKADADLGAKMMNVSRSEEHTSELQSLMRISYAVFCLKKKKQTRTSR